MTIHPKGRYCMIFYRGRECISCQKERVHGQRGRVERRESLGAKEDGWLMKRKLEEWSSSKHQEDWRKRTRGQAGASKRFQDLSSLGGAEDLVCKIRCWVRFAIKLQRGRLLEFLFCCNLIGCIQFHSLSSHSFMFFILGSSCIFLFHNPCFY